MDFGPLRFHQFYFFYFSMTDIFYKRNFKKTRPQIQYQCQNKTKIPSNVHSDNPRQREKSVKHTAEGIRCYDYSLLKGQG